MELVWMTMTGIRPLIFIPDKSVKNLEIFNARYRSYGLAGTFARVVGNPDATHFAKHLVKKP
jgi:hypothetical protein